MEILNKQEIHKFAAKHANCRKALNEWVSKVEFANWTTLIDIQKTFNSADPVGGYVVFNIGGNNARLVAVATFAKGNVTIVKVMTHAEYDRWAP